MIALLYVFFGGGCGASSRWVIGLICKQILPSSFPYGTLVANVLGAVLIGIAYSWFQKNTHMSHLMPLFVTGFLGGFTTFSSFSLESFLLFDQGLHLKALLNLLLNVTLCLIGVWLGQWIYRTLH